jgi:8-oxo-dGTP diphosphatase
MINKKIIEVVAAIIYNEGKILCVQRGENKYDYISKKYEFPGGKIEIGEGKEEALIREIFEELKIEINLLNEFLTINHTYPDFDLVMHSFTCTIKNQTLTLTEHIDYKWLYKEELLGLDWAAADIPIIKKLQELKYK